MHHLLNLVLVRKVWSEITLSTLPVEKKEFVIESKHAACISKCCVF
jgi:hypothetical protein